MKRLLLLLVFLLVSFSLHAQNFWEQTKGPVGGTVPALAINSSGVIFAGSYENGIFRSVDNGKNWVWMGLQNIHVNTIAISLNGYIFVGSNGSGIFRSTDNGTTWTQTSLTNSYTYAIAINGDGVVFAGANGVMRSTDNGTTWTQTGLTNATILSLAINGSGDILAGESYYHSYPYYFGGIYRSTDNGNNWTSLNTDYIGNYGVYSIAINSSGDIFAGAFYSGFSRNYSYVLRSTDNGINWTESTTGLPTSAFFPSSLVINSSSDIFLGTNQGVYLSTDKGINWTKTGLLNKWAKSLVVNNSGNIFAGTYYEGVFCTTDNGDNWTQSNTGLTANNIISLVVNSTGNIFAGVQRGGIARSTDNGNSWTQAVLPTSVSSFAISSSGDIFAGSYGVYRSTDNGNNWIPTGLINDYAYSIAINSSGDIFAGANGVMRSTDNGNSWTQTGFINRFATTIAINSSGYIFAGTPSEGVFRSMDNGNNWTKKVSGMPTDAEVTSLVINNSGNIFAGVNGSGVFQSTDNGNNWTQINSGLSDTKVYSLLINSSGYIFAGTNGSGVFRSTNNGNNWTQINPGLTAYTVNTLAVNSGGYLFVGTSGSSVFRSLSTTTLSKPILALPLNNSIENIQPVIVKWNAQPNDDFYRLQVSTDSLFTTLFMDDSTLVDTFKTLPQLNNLTKYYWRVKAKYYIDGESNWSEVWNFKTVGLPTSVLTITPNDQPVAASSGTTTFTVSNTGGGTMNWTASITSSSSWLTITSGSSGTNSGTISCAYTANTGSQRVGTITVTAIGATGSPATVTVTQAQPTGPGWVPVANQQFNMSIIGQLYFENILTSVSSDVIGAFVGTECRGIASPTSNNGIFFLTVTSNSASGETITFKAYKASTGQITDASPSLPFQNMGEVGTLATPQRFDAGLKELLLNFGAGYTWFSVNVNPGDLNLNPLFNPPALNPSANDRINGQTSFASWSGTQWIGSLTAINPKYSYVMKLTTAQACTLKGQPIPPSSNAINLGAGWTWTGYLPQTQQPINTALANFTPAPSANDRVTAQNSFAAWGGASWIGSLTAMYPGYGYKIKVANASTLTYPSSMLLKAPGNTAPNIVLGAPNWIPVPNQQFNMSIIGKIKVVETLITDPNDIIGAFVGSECRGIASPVTQDGIFFLTVTSNIGTTPGETVNFKVYHAAEDKIFEGANAPAPITFVNMGEIGTLDNPWIYSFTPVELTSFAASVIKNGVNLTWSTATETNNKGFSIERKTENENWHSVGFIEGNGTTTESQSYHFNDSKFSNSGKYYYRLKQIDFDGTYTYSKEINLEVDFIPSDYSLSQNYPNPFNPSTKINYGIPEDTKVTIKLFDVIGNEIITLVDENKSAGSYEVILDAANLQSGIYFYRLQAGKFTMAKKIILLK